MRRRLLGFLASSQLLTLTPAPAVHATDHEDHAAVAAEAPTAATAANAAGMLDTRTPVPLLPMMAQHQKEQMRDHLLAIQEIIEATSREAWQEVETSAARIGYSESMAAMCEHMGAATPGFSDVALRFHQTADLIAEAARAHDAKSVLEKTAATVAVCTGCHAAYKQQIVDDDEWQRLTGTQAPAPGEHHPPH